MKLRFILLSTIFIMSLALCGCGENSVDVGEYAIISLPNGEVVEGEVESLIRWTASNTEITIDGITYYVHPLNVAIIEKNENSQKPLDN